MSTAPSLGAAWRGDVPGIVAEIRQDYIETEGSIGAPWARSVGDHARVWGYRYLRVMIENPKRFPNGRIDYKKNHLLCAAVREAVEIIINERVEAIRTQRTAEAVVK
jgi:hypothetical protein